MLLWKKQFSDSKHEVNYWIFVVYNGLVLTLNLCEEFQIPLPEQGG